MKKILLGLLAVAFTNIAFGQVSFGVKGSYQMTNISNIHHDSKSRKAASIGVVARIPIDDSEMLYVQPELMYSMEGEKDGLGNYGMGTGKNYYQDYLRLPVLFKVYFSEAESEFFAEVGPTFGFMISQKEEKADEALYTKPKKFDASASLGFGYSFDRKYEVSGRYNFGMLDNYPKAEKVQRTSVLQLSFAYMF